MGIISDIKKDAAKNRTVIQSSEAEKLSRIFNKAFYAPHNIKEETKFIHSVMTRGSGDLERVGLHASAMLVSEPQFCVRQHVLSLVYHMRPPKMVQIGLMRIFEEGNAVHEKWQRLFIRAGWSSWNELDFTKYNEHYHMSFTPDIICTIPDFYDSPMVGEIKSVNTFAFKKQTKHPTAWKQCQWYMHLTGIHKGFVLSDDKNCQEFKLEVLDYDFDKVQPFIDRAEQIVSAYDNLIDNHKMVRRPLDAKSPTCKRCKDCPMRDACWDVGMGRVKLSDPMLEQA
nr:MAG TPA: Exonuclease [Caudoviricetes sp.]